jgi:putative nucleotidyltransferase with HDIG domain
MSDSTLRSINARIESFPTLPAIVGKVMAVTANPESSAGDLMQVVLPDQSMCATILKVANSAFFGMPREVSTIERAVVVLGFQEIKNIVIGKAIFAAFPKMTRETRHNVGLFWEHTFTCGLAAKIIAEQLRLSASELFIAGLIHDIGKLAMFLTFPDNYPLLKTATGISLQDMLGEEHRQFTISHDQVGLILAKKWLLPEQLAMAIGYHHAPGKAPAHRPYALIVQIADTLSLLYSCPERFRPEDITKIFTDFLPETQILWKELGLPWSNDDLGIWFERLHQSRARDQAVLKIFTSP